MPEYYYGIARARKNLILLLMPDVDALLSGGETGNLFGLVIGKDVKKM
ncbi:MAG: hypothetical protein ACXWAA_16475 [Methylobacter sp.]